MRGVLFAQGSFFPALGFSHLRPTKKKHHSKTGDAMGSAFHGNATVSIRNGARGEDKALMKDSTSAAASRTSCASERGRGLLLNRVLRNRRFQQYPPRSLRTLSSKKGPKPRKMGNQTFERWSSPPYLKGEPGGGSGALNSP